MSNINNVATYENKVLSLPLYRGRVTFNGASPWWAEARIGTPSSQSFRFLVDTGTRYSWVTSLECTTRECSIHRRFNQELSSTFEMIDGEIEQINFGPWGTLYAKLGRDVLTMHNDVPLRNMDFHLATQYRGVQWMELIQDGFLACGATQKDARSTMLFTKLWRDGALAKPVMSYYGNYTVGGSQRDRGEVRFGSDNPTRYDPNTVRIMEQNKDSDFNMYWVTDCRDMKVNGQSITGSFEAIMDTGASNFKGDPESIQALRRAVTYNGRLPSCPDNPDRYNYPDLEIHLGKHESNGRPAIFSMKPRQYFQFIEGGNDRGTWQLGFEEMAGLGKRIVFGSLLLDDYHTIWEYDTSTPDLAGESIKLANKVRS